MEALFLDDLHGFIILGVSYMSFQYLPSLMRILYPIPQMLLQMLAKPQHQLYIIYSPFPSVPPLPLLFPQNATMSSIQFQSLQKPIDLPQQNLVIQCIARKFIAGDFSVEGANDGAFGNIIVCWWSRCS